MPVVGIGQNRHPHHRGSSVLSCYGTIGEVTENQSKSAKADALLDGSLVAIKPKRAPTHRSTDALNGSPRETDVWLSKLYENRHHGSFFSRVTVTRKYTVSLVASAL